MVGTSRCQIRSLASGVRSRRGRLLPWTNADMDRDSGLKTVGSSPNAAIDIVASRISRCDPVSLSCLVGIDHGVEPSRTRGGRSTPLTIRFSTLEYQRGKDGGARLPLSCFLYICLKVARRPPSSLFYKPCLARRTPSHRVVVRGAFTYNASPLVKEIPSPPHTAFFPSHLILSCLLL